MSDLRTIEIDFDVNKRIELERRSFSESANEVLRRLLGITGAPPLAEPHGRPWASKGVTLPHGTQLRMEYNGQVYTGAIENGTWVVEGGEYKSPSAAAGGVARTKDGKSPSLDGWHYWSVKRPGEARWTPISTFRPNGRA